MDHVGGHPENGSPKNDELKHSDGMEPIVPITELNVSTPTQAMEAIPDGDDDRLTDREREVMQTIEKMRRRGDITNPDTGDHPIIEVGNINVGPFIRAQARFTEALMVFNERRASCNSRREWVQILGEFSHEQTVFLRSQQEMLRQLGVL